MAPPKVSFALTCYEHEDFVRDAVRGALAQDYEPLEILFSDDCSPDATFDILEEEVSRYDGPHTLSMNRNTTNLGIEHFDKVMTLARGDFVVFAHGDDISMPHRTRRLVDAWIKQDVSLVSSNAAMIDAEAGPAGLFDPGVNQPPRSGGTCAGLRTPRNLLLRRLLARRHLRHSRGRGIGV